MERVFVVVPLFADGVQPRDEAVVGADRQGRAYVLGVRGAVR